MAARPRSSVSPEELLAQLGWMRALAQRLVYDPDLADDVLQQACLLALERGPDSARQGAGLRAWLAAVTRRLALHSGRARSRRQRREQAAAQAEALPSTIDRVQHREALAGLVEALTALEEPHYSTIVARYFEGLSIDELAARAAITTVAARQRLSRAKQQLRARLERRIADDRSGWLALALTGGLREPAGQGVAGATRLAAARASYHSGEIIMAKAFSTAGIGKLAAGLLIALGVALLMWPERRTAGDEAPSAVSRPEPSRNAPAFAVPAADLPAPPVSDAQTLAPIEDSGAATKPEAPPPAAADVGAARGTYRVVVVDLEARPVPGAYVDALRRGPPLNPDSPRAPPTYAAVASTRADASGRCTLTLPDPGDLVSVAHETVGSSGMLSERALGSLLNADGDTVIRLVPYLTVEGLVVDAADQPIAGSPVAFQSSGATPHPMPRLAPPVFTGADGRFYATVDFATQYSIGTAWRGRVAAEIVNPRYGEPVFVKLQLPGDWSISGTLVDEHGAPVAAVKVVAWGSKPEGERDLAAPAPGFRTHFMADTASDGTFTLPITAPGSYGLTALGAGRTVPEPVWVELGGSEAHPRVDLVLPMPTAISGQVTGHDCAPGARATVEVRAAPPTLLEGNLFLLPSVSRTLSTRTRKDGSFSVTPLPTSGVYEIRAWFRSAVGPAIPPDDDEVPWVPVEAGRSDVVLVASEVGPQKAEIRIRVTTAQPGQPLDHVIWSVVSEGGTSAFALSTGTFGDGLIVVPDLDPDVEYTVAVAAEGLGVVDLHHVVPDTDGQPLAVELPALGALTATVVDADGAGVPFAQVEIRRSFVLIREFLGANGVPPRASDADGAAPFEGLDPGRYAVVATALGQRIESVAEVPAGGRATLRLQLPASR